MWRAACTGREVGAMDRYAPGAVGMDGEAVGAAMRLARRRVGLSQRGLADALGWSRAKVGRWENGTVPQGFDEVVSILRVLGFELALRDPTAAQWAEWDEPAEHVLDRGDRRFPAHLELCEEFAAATWNWTRHRSEHSPHAARTSFRRRTQVEALAADRRSREWARGNGGSTAAGSETESTSAPESKSAPKPQLPTQPEPEPEPEPERGPGTPAPPVPEES